MKSIVSPIQRPLLYVAGFSLIINLLLLAPALFMLQVFDRVLSSQSQATLLMLLVAMGVALTLMLALDYLRSRMQGAIGNLLAGSLAPRVATLMLAASARRSTDAQAEGLRDVAVLRNLFSAQGLLALFDAPWAVVYLAVIWMAHPLLGAGALAASVLMLALALVNDRVTRRGIKAVQQAATHATRYLEASMQNAEVVQSLGMRPALLARWQVLMARVAAEQGPLSDRSVAMAALTRTSRQAVQVLIQALGAYLVISGEGTAGILVATTILLGRALSPVEQMVGNWRTLAEGLMAGRRLGNMLEQAQESPQRMPLPPPTGRLEVQSLVYRADASDRVILAGVSLSLAPGESLAVIGPSGAGKSTLARLIMGVWAPHAGVVRLDHVDVAQWERDELGPWLGYVPQDVELFAGSVAENIARLGEVDSAKVVRAAQRAGIHELLLSLPQGYETRIEAQGPVLSPGQRQRIALARALYGEPKLLVLDEPNSNLDGAGEAALAEALRALKGQVSVVVITHRSSLVQHVDKVLVLEGGRVQHFGPRDEVMRAVMTDSARVSAAQALSVPRALGPVAGRSATVGTQVKETVK